jgi:putative ABC transport system ATP-binding protein
MTPPALDIRSLSKTFDAGEPGQVRALRDVSLSVEAGALVVVVGTNGSGKSCLLNAVAGSFPIDAGSIAIEGQDVTAWTDHRRASLIGRVFQDPLAGTAPALSVAENLALARRRGQPRGLRRALTKETRAECLVRVHALGMGLEDRLDQPSGSLTPGQRQAITLVMATWPRPRLLLLDEHTAALDPKSAERLTHLTQEIVARDALTTVMVTHSMPQAVNLGNRLLMMHRGRIIHDFQGAEKGRLRVQDLLGRFEAVRNAELLDESAAEMLRRMYV